MNHAQLSCSRLLKGCYRLTENELLGLQDMADCLQKLLMEGSILAFEVEHGNRL
jgi:hypothetical protein